MFTFRHLEVFIAVAEELHFGRAAERLGIGQPPLSQLIHRLEADLGVDLLARTRRKVELTDAGRTFLAEARALLDQAARARSLAVRAGRGEVGALSIAIVPTADNFTLMRVIRAFGARHPDVRVSIRSLSTAAQVEALHRNEIHAGFVRMPVRDPRLEARVILRESLVVALPRDHRLARHRRVPLRLVSQEPIVLFPRRLAPDYYDSLVSAFYAAGLSLNVAHESEHVQTMLGLIVSGFGISLLPESIREFQHAGIVFRPLTPAHPTVETGLVADPRNDSTTLRAFRSFVEAALAAPR